MNKIKLNTNFKFQPDELQPFPRKNFAAICFFDFFWKGKKIMSFPMQSNLFPWGARVFDKEYLEEEIIVKSKFEYLNNLFVKNNYILSFNFNLFDDLLWRKDSQFWFWFKEFFKEEFRITPEKEAAGLRRFGEGDIAIFLYFEKIMREEVFDFLFFHSEKAKEKLVDFIMNSEFSIEDEVYILSFIGYSHINFYEDFPARKIINLEEYFSDQQMEELLDKVSKLGLDKNPFSGGIENSIEEYKEFLLTLLGPGKWEYTNLEIEKLDLSIEELAVLFVFLRYLKMPLEYSDEPSCYPRLEKSEEFFLTLPYNYFWYKLKETVLLINKKIKK